MKKFFLLTVLLVCLSSCKEDPQPKPKGFLAMDYPGAEYRAFRATGCPYNFEKNLLARITKPREDRQCWLNLEYNLLNSTIFLTYQPVKGNLDSLLRDAQQLPLQHTIKADAIEGDIYSNPYHETYGMFYEVSGDAASQAQFYLTDSLNHFLTGSLYFNAQPNFDSLIPAAAYLKNDMRHLMETLTWK